MADIDPAIVSAAAAAAILNDPASRPDPTSEGSASLVDTSSSRNALESLASRVRDLEQRVMRSAQQERWVRDVWTFQEAETGDNIGCAAAQPANGSLSNALVATLFTSRLQIATMLRFKEQQRRVELALALAHARSALLLNASAK
jgi:hypothetical protein